MARATSRARRICAKYECETFAKSPEVRVFRVVPRRGQTYSEYADYAEWLPTERLTLIGRGAEVDVKRSRPDVVVAGDMGAYVVSEGVNKNPNGVVGASLDVGRVDARTGVIVALSATGEEDNEFGVGSPGVTDLRVTPAGSVAWIIAGKFRDPDAPMQVAESTAVFALSAGVKESRLLSYSSLVERGSLAEIPGHIYWLEGGTARTFAAP
jgi:hypothetical protein